MVTDANVSNCRDHDGSSFPGLFWGLSEIIQGKDSVHTQSTQTGINKHAGIASLKKYLSNTEGKK